MSVFQIIYMVIYNWCDLKLSKNVVVWLFSCESWNKAVVLVRSLYNCVKFELCKNNFFCCFMSIILVRTNRQHCRTGISDGMVREASCEGEANPCAGTYVQNK